jgi:predicted alpha/beta superfamily hydrolase
MDGALLFDLTVGIVSLFAVGARLPEMIVVGVGHPSSEGMAGLAKRTIDLFPPGSTLADDGPAADYARGKMGMDQAAVFAGVKGDRFLDFLIDHARPELGRKYRMEDDHVLFGHSAGGAFAGYALFARPGGFSRYIIGSGTNGLTLELEARYAAQHDDLKASVFVGAADLEANNAALSAQRIVSRTVLLAENLRLRGYPSLRLKTRLYTDRDHFTVVPLITGDGLETVFADEAARLPKLPW